MAGDQNFEGLASGEVVCTRAIVRLVPSIRWDADKVGMIHVTPFDYKSRHQDVIEEDPDPHSQPEPKPDDDAINISKRVNIFASDLTDLKHFHTLRIAHDAPLCDVANY